jgi:cytosine/adenosine deaminase-related metal-dependent hydrolase
MLKMSDRIGSLTPGKQADVVMVRVDDLNMLPVHDPVASVVTQTSLSNIDTVLVAGTIQKRHGKLLFGALADRQNSLQQSGGRIVHDLQKLVALQHQ